MSAAVSDYKPSESYKNKLKKSSNKSLQIELKQNKDIIKNLGSIKDKNQKLIGFALETDDEIRNAKIKLKNKNLDAIVLNSLNINGAGFNSNTNKISFITSSLIKDFPLKNKRNVAKDVLLEIFNL